MPQRIVLIDRFPELRTLFCDILEEEGYEVIPFAIPPGCVDAISHLKPDLIIVDHYLHRDVQECELLSRLASDSRTVSIPLLVCTAMYGQELQQFRQASGGDRITFISRPFDISELLASVATHLRSRLLGQAAVSLSPAG